MQFFGGNSALSRGELRINKDATCALKYLKSRSGTPSIAMNTKNHAPRSPNKKENKTMTTEELFASSFQKTVLSKNYHCDNCQVVCGGDSCIDVDAPY